MARVKASQVLICVFWHNSLNYQEVETTWPEDVRTAWNALANAVINLRNRHGNNVPIEMYLCPVDISDNAVIVAQEGLDFSLLPAVQVYAEYPDGTASKYFLSRSLSDRFTGVNWTASEVQPYIEALLYRAKFAEQSLLCKLFPPLCSVGGWVWLGLAAAATLKATRSNGAGRLAWGIGAGFLWKEWYDRGGLRQLTETVTNTK